MITTIQHIILGMTWGEKRTLTCWKYHSFISLSITQHASIKTSIMKWNNFVEWNGMKRYNAGRCEMENATESTELHYSIIVESYTEYSQKNRFFFLFNFLSSMYAYIVNMAHIRWNVICRVAGHLIHFSDDFLRLHFDLFEWRNENIDPPNCQSLLWKMCNRNE